MGHGHSGLNLDDPTSFDRWKPVWGGYHTKATWTFFIGNLEKDEMAAKLGASFETFGPIIESDMKRKKAESRLFVRRHK
jgi:hypothetical protein